MRLSCVAGPAAVSFISALPDGSGCWRRKEGGKKKDGIAIGDHPDGFRKRKSREKKK